MSLLWWLLLPVLLLPFWWHRQRREQAGAPPLASARFLPRADPLRLRVWRLRDRTLLLVRCALLALVVAWLAGWVFPWRGDAVLIAPGTERGWAEQQIQAAGFADADRMPMAGRDVFGWLARHEAEWRDSARLLVVGDVAMPAQRPRLRHEVTVRARVNPLQASVRHVVVYSPRAAEWRRFFDAQGVQLDAVPDARTELIVWDRLTPPPAGLRAPLWWTGAASAFPQLEHASTGGGIRYADSAQGRVWQVAPPHNLEAARALVETWQRQHGDTPFYTTPSQTIAANPRPGLPAGGAQHYWLTLALMALFAIERIMSHASSR